MNRTEVIRDLVSAIESHERRCGDLGFNPDHNVGDGLHLTREAAEGLIVLLTEGLTEAGRGESSW